MADLSFLADFPAPTREAWLKLVEGVLKGASFERRLVSTTADGIRIEPLYGKAEGRAPLAGRPAGAPWAVLQRVDHPDPREANALALADLENGATGLQLVFAGSQGDAGFGLADGSAATLEAVLDGVVLDAGIRIELDLSYACKDAPQHLLDIAARRGIDPAALDAGLGFDPLGQMALAGDSPVPWAELAPMFGGLASAFRSTGFGGQVAAADGRVVHAAGGSEAQELAFAMACALAYWRALEAAGIAPEQGRSMIAFRLAADADQFLTIAKFRAARLLWARIEEASGLTPAPIRLHAETAWRMLTRDDPWVNLLRDTVAAFSAGVGGADSVSVLPFTAALGLPDAFARRLARNTQLILLEEANLARVLDPAAGSGGIEALTDALAERAWSILQEIESRGGLERALADGVFQADVAKVREARSRDIAARKRPLTGTSDFPDLGQQPVAVLREIAVGGVPPRPAWSGWAPLAPHRDAEPYEALRRAARAASPAAAIFLANLGPVADFTARATFAKSLFEAGGIAAPGNDGFAQADGSTDLAALAAAFAASGAAIACLCSTDERYVAEAQAAARALKQAGAKQVWLAGRPGENEAALRDAGVDGFVFAGCDALAALRQAHAALGLAETE